MTKFNYLYVKCHGLSDGFKLDEVFSFPSSVLLTMQNLSHLLS
jgi:hypothetical protein